MTKVLPIAGIRVGHDGDVARVIERVLSRPGSGLFGRPKSDLGAVAMARKTGRPCVRWFMVATDDRDDPVAVAFYESGVSTKIPNIRVTSAAVDGALDVADQAGVAAALVGGVVAKFAADSAGRGYLAADVEHSATSVSDLLLASGWRGLIPRFGWATDRYVYFVSGVADGVRKDADRPD